MEDINWAQVINWFTESGIGFVFTFLGAYAAFRFALLQDEKKREAEAKVNERERLAAEEKEKERIRREQLLGGSISYEDMRQMDKFQGIIDELKRAKR